MSGMPASFGASARFAFAGEPSSAFIDLGSEPPLTLGSPSVGAPARRAVSVRWLSGTVLTGLTALVLMGGALNVALNSQQLAAVPPETADLAFLNANITAGEKGDRILPVAAPPTTREVVPVTVAVREGDREFFRQQDYAYINATLAAAIADGVEVPAYDPVRVVGEAANNQPAEAGMPAEIAEGDVDGGNAAVRTMPFPLAAEITAAPPIDTADIVAIVRANAAMLAAGADLWPTVMAYTNVSGIGLGLLDDAANAAGLRAIPENVGYLTKAGQGDGGRDERLVRFEAGTTLAHLLADAGVPEGDIDETLGVMDGLIDLAALTPENQARIAFAPNAAAPGGRQLLRVSIYENGTHQATVARDDGGVFVRADEPGPLPQAAENSGRVVAGALPRLYDALYLTALEQGVPERQINDLVRIFAFELDMLATVGPTDTVSFFYGLPASGSETTGQDAILYAAVTVAGTTTAYYRFQTNDGVINYFDANGASADNFLLRKPMSGGEFRSGYGNRLHPITGVYRLHAGVDWSAPAGTPIVAAGDGEIVTMEYNSGGYGRYVVVRHANGYESAYAHMSAFAQGLQRGDTVRQGQVIGYVGSTGLSTGNHLHYEVRINGQTVNPLTIRLPEGRVLTGEELVAFQAARNQINELLGITLDETQVAAAD